MTKLRMGLLGATMLGAAWLPCAATAQQITGLYVGAGLGYSILSDQNVNIDAVVPFAPVQTAKKLASFNGGLGIVGSVGYGVGNGVRVEVEGNYRSNQQTSETKGSTGLATGTETKYGVMANVLYDIDTGLNWIYPYVGAGAGYQFAEWSNVSFAVGGISYFQGNTPVVTRSQTIGKLAYQAIVGLSFPIEYVPGLSVTAEYRYSATSGTRNYSAAANLPFGASNLPTKVHAPDNENHTFLLGLRYAFNVEPETEPAAPVQAAPPQPVPTATASRSYIVFFDFDRADLTPRARDIIAEAVRASARIPHTRIEVAGNADRSGTPSYNQALSLRRAEAVADEMGRWGVPRNVIDIRAFGDTRPLVPTAAGVREPQNRRVEIVYR